MKVYDTIIIGSGYFAWGYALTHENTLIVEETQVADRHFGGCLRGFECEAPVLSTEGARALWDHVCTLGLFRNGRLSVTGLEAALCEAFGAVCDTVDVLSEKEGYVELIVGDLTKPQIDGILAKFGGAESVIRIYR